jgi:hypothetical protein
MLMRFSKKVYIAGAVILLLPFVLVPLVIVNSAKGQKAGNVAIVDQAATVSEPQLEQHVQEAPMVASTDPSIAVQALASQSVADIPAASEKPAGSVAMPAAVTTDDAAATETTTAPAAAPSGDSSITTSVSDSQNAADASASSMNPQTFGTVDDPSSDSVIISPDESGEQTRFPVRPSLMVRGVFDDNIFISPNKTADFVWTIAPGLVYQTGDPTLESNNYFEIGFVPSIILYTDNSDQDAVDFDAWAKYDHRFNQLTLGISQRFLQISGSDVQVGNLVDRDIYTTQVTGNYDFSDKLNMDGALTQTISDYTSYNDINEWTAEAYAYYKFLPKTALGLGPKLGFVDVVPGPNISPAKAATPLPAPNQTYQQLVAKLVWDPTAKLRFKAYVGGEVREFQDNAASTRLSPVFGLAGTWDATDSTTVTIGGSRENNASPSQVSTNYAATMIYGKVRQRFLQKFYLGLSGGYENDDYSASGSTTAVAANLVDRQDNYYYVKPQFDCDITQWWGVTVFYQFRENDSNVASVAFNNNQVGIQTYLRY